MVPPDGMKRAMAKQAEAERERRAKIVNADAGFFPLLGNMIYLFLFGCCVEDMIGRGRFLALYLIGGFGRQPRLYRADARATAPTTRYKSGKCWPKAPSATWRNTGATE